MKTPCLVGFVALRLFGAVAHGGWVDWVHWQSYTLGETTGVATGTIASPGGPVGASYSGNLFDAWLSPAQSGNVDPWPGAPDYTAYDTPAIENRPPDHQILWQARGNWTSSITFSQPVADLYMTIYSLGGGNGGALYGVSYDFDASFDIVDSGSGRDGPGVMSQLPNDVLYGENGNGIIHFQGPVTKITWASTYVAYEGVNGFTFGTPAAPEPSILSVGALFLAALKAGRPCRR